MNATHCLTLCVFAVRAHLGEGRSASNMVAQEPSVFGFGLFFALEMRFLPRTYGRQLTLGWLAIRSQESACLCSPAPGSPEHATTPGFSHYTEPQTQGLVLS